MSKGRKQPQQDMENRLAAIGLNLRIIRQRRGFTQRRLGERIGLTREAITAYEAGKAHLTDTTLLDLAAVLRVSVNEILGEETSETPEISRRWAKGMEAIESLPGAIKKHILRTLDDVIKANTHLSIFEDGQE
jgi:transcriptional regulator with XRE-family HTH domain